MWKHANLLILLLALCFLSAVRYCCRCCWDVTRPIKSNSLFTTLHFLSCVSDKRTTTGGFPNRTRQKTDICQLVIRLVYYVDCVCLCAREFVPITRFVGINPRHFLQFDISCLFVFHPAVPYFRNYNCEWLFCTCGRSNSQYPRINEVNSRQQIGIDIRLDFTNFLKSNKTIQNTSFQLMKHTVSFTSSTCGLNTSVHIFFSINKSISNRFQHFQIFPFPIGRLFAIFQIR